MRPGCDQDRADEADHEPHTSNDGRRSHRPAENQPRGLAEVAVEDGHAKGEEGEKGEKQEEKDHGGLICRSWFPGPSASQREVRPGARRDRRFAGLSAFSNQWCAYGSSLKGLTSR